MESDENKFNNNVDIEIFVTNKLRSTVECIII